jgi:hypothetical protein
LTNRFGRAGFSTSYPQMYYEPITNDHGKITGIFKTLNFVQCHNDMIG